MPTAIRATYSDVKMIKSRQVVQFVFEVPLAEFDQAYEVLGGLPNPASERWCAIAPIKSSAAAAQGSGQAGSDTPPARTKRTWHEMSAPQQAGIRCDEPPFAVFLAEEYPEEWHEAMNDAAECVRMICYVASRADLQVDSAAEQRWRHLDDRYQAWRTMERVA